MALVDNVWYVDFGNGSSTGYYAVTAWSAGASKVCGNLVRQSAAPSVGNERVFVCIASTGGTGQTAGTEPVWVLTRGANTGANIDNTVTWQEASGIAALNGDLSTNTPTWTTIKNTAVTLGQVIQNVAGTLVLICTTAGTAGNGAEPSWAAFTNAGATTADNSVTWTTLGASFANWAAPHARLTNACIATWGKAGNSFYVASEHVETENRGGGSGAAIAIGSLASPISVYCVTKTNVPPTSANLTTGASITSTVTTFGTTWDFGSTVGYFYGLTFIVTASSGIMSFSDTSATLYFKNCSFTLTTTSAAVFKLNFSSGTNPLAIFDGCTFTFANSTGSTFTSVTTFGKTVFKNCTFSTAAAVPTTVFTGAGATLVLTGCDLSAFGSGKTLIGASATYYALMQQCKLGASVTVAASPTTLSQRIDMILCDSSGTNYRTESYQTAGTQTTETTIVRTGGASDGTTPISWKVVTAASSKWILPFECIPITVWCETTGSHTVTVYGTTTGGGVPNNDDIWITAEYLKDSGDPLGGFVTTTKSDNLAASTTTNNSSDASTWGGGGAGNGFKMVTPSFTVNQKGPITIYVYVAKATTTYYVDPRPAINGITVNRSMILAPGVYANELGGGSGSFSYIS